MKSAFKTAAKIFKYASWLFIILYCGYILYDDFIFIRQISGFSDFFLFLGIQTLYLTIYFTVFSAYYWLVAVFVVFIYVKFFKPKAV